MLQMSNSLDDCTVALLFTSVPMWRGKFDVPISNFDWSLQKEHLQQWETWTRRRGWCFGSRLSTFHNLDVLPSRPGYVSFATLKWNGRGKQLELLEELSGHARLSTQISDRVFVWGLCVREERERVRMTSSRSGGREWTKCVFACLVCCRNVALKWRKSMHGILSHTHVHAVPG